MLRDSDFVHTHLHTDRGSNIRMKDSTVKIKEALLYANEIGNKAMAITDHESLSAHIKAINVLNELKSNEQIDKDFKLLLGNEIYLIGKEELKNKLNKGEKVTFHHFILIAKDEIGHEQLRLLSSRAWRDNYLNYKGMARVPTYYSDIEEIIGENKGHLIAQSACLGSLLGNLNNEILEMDSDEDKIYEIKDKMADFVEWCIEVFGEEDFYLEMQPNSNLQQIEYNKLLVRMSEAYRLKTTITTDVHFISEEDRVVHKAFLTSDDKDANREVDDFYETTRFFKVEEFYECMKYLDEEIIEKSILNTKEISDKCEVGDINDYGLFKPTKIPLTPLPSKKDWFPVNTIYINKYEYIKKTYEDKYEYHTYLIHQIFKGLKERQIDLKDYGEYFERINLELEEIYSLSVDMEQPIGAYLTTMQRNIQEIWETSIVGVGRGSSVCYVIDYLLEITDVDPLRQKDIKLPHWRFIHKSKQEMPDVDSDFASNLKNEVFFKQRDFYRSFGGDVVRVSTFKTETSKSAIKTACRGLNINSDISQYISSLVSIERGKVWSISDMYYGDKKKNRVPSTEFVNIINSYSNINLLGTILKIEGLVSGIGSHACGVIPNNGRIEDSCGLMRTPSGEIITSFDLHELEKTGKIKYDYLLTNGIAILQLMIQLLVKYGYMQWQGSLRETYKKYLLPEVIGSEDEEIWDNICQGKIMNLFQFDTPVGGDTIKKLQPRSLVDLSNANALMRLMAQDGQEQPLDKYIKFKNNPNLWEKEMIDFGLNEEDRQVAHELLDDQCGVCSNQESMMEMFMHPKVANYSVKEVNKIKKGVAKKLEKVQKEAHEDLCTTQQKLHTSKKLVDYCWDVQTSYQLGYAFSKPHCIAYSWVGYQDGYLYTKYPSIFWYTANLIAMTDSYEDTKKEKLNYDFEIKEKTTDYGKVAKSISRVQKEGVTVTPPLINESELGFVPDVKTNSIIFGLKGVVGINSEICDYIIKNKPYKSLKDFYNKLVKNKREVVTSTGKKQMKSYVTNGQIINLIKAGSFDTLENKKREAILEEYIFLTNPPKKKLTSTDIGMMSEMGIIPSDFKNEVRYYNFRKFIMTLPKYQDEETKSIVWYKIDCDEDTEYTNEFFLNNFAIEMEEGRDYFYDEKGIINIALKTNRKGSFEDVYNRKMNFLADWLSSKESIDYYNKIKFENTKREVMDGTISSWEMESMGFYYHEHELNNINSDKYIISNFFELNEDPTIIGYNQYKDIKYPKYELSNIVGTVLDRDKNKHFVTLLTPQGVIGVKFYDGQFGFYDRTISIDDGINEKTGKPKKITLEESWFKRGNLLYITGFRRGDNFHPKRYKNSIYQHTVQLIKEVKENGDLIMQSDRVKVEDFIN